MFMIRPVSVYRHTTWGRSRKNQGGGVAASGVLKWGTLVNLVFSHDCLRPFLFNTTNRSNYFHDASWKMANSSASSTTSLFERLFSGDVLRPWHLLCGIIA
jgi:hypothetical protein